MNSSLGSIINQPIKTNFLKYRRGGRLGFGAVMSRIPVRSLIFFTNNVSDAAINQGANIFLGPGCTSNNLGAGGFVWGGANENGFLAGTGNHNGGVNLGGSFNGNYTSITIGSGNTNPSINGAFVAGMDSNVGGVGVSIGKSIINNVNFGYALSYKTRTDRQGLFARANSSFSAVGDQQEILMVFGNSVSGNTPTLLTGELGIPSGKTMHLIATITGVKSNGTVASRFIRQVSVKNRVGTTSIVGEVTTIGQDEASGTSITIFANDSTDSLRVEVTGIEAETWRWIVTIKGIEIAYGT